MRITGLARTCAGLWLLVGALLAIDTPAFAQILRAVPGLPQKGVSVHDFLGQIWFKGHDDVWRLDGETAKPLLKREGLTVWDVALARGEIWIATTQGTFVYRNGAAVMQLPDIEIQRIHAVAGSVWLQARRGGIYVSSGETYVRIGPADLTVSRIDQYGQEVVVRGDSRSVNATFYLFDGKTLVPMLDSGEPIAGIEHTGGQLWVRTRTQAYRIVNHRPERIQGLNGTVRNLFTVGERVWIQSSSGLYLMNGSQPMFVTTASVSEFSILEHGGVSWVPTDTELLRVRQASVDTFPLSPRPPLQKSSIYVSPGQVICESGNTAWIVQPTVVSRINGTELEPVIPGAAKIRSCKTIRFKERGRVWFEGESGLYATGATGATSVSKILDGAVTLNSGSMSDESSNITWLATSRGAYRVRGNDAERIPDEAHDVKRIVAGKGYATFQTLSGLYHVRQDRTIKLTDIFPVEYQTDIDDDTELFVSPRGVFSVTREGARKLSTKTIDVDYPFRNNGYAYLRTKEAIYAASAETFAKVMTIGPKGYTPNTTIGGVMWVWYRDRLYRADRGRLVLSHDGIPGLITGGFKEIRGRHWLQTERGVYVLDPDVTLTARLASRDSWWNRMLAAVFPGNVWSQGSMTLVPAYVATNGADRGLPDEFGIILENGDEAFEKAIEQQNFGPRQTFAREVGIGQQRLSGSVRDAWGNVAIVGPVTVFVVPGMVLVSGAAALVWIGAVTLVIGLAPRSKTAQSLLMNPWVRSYGSFGVIPLVLSTSATVRSYVLRPYIARVKATPRFERWRTRHDSLRPEMQPAEIFTRVLDGPEILLGPSGIGKTALLEALVLQIASARTRWSPVFISLPMYAGRSLTEAFRDALAADGRITDNELADWFLTQGGFIFCLDGLNEVDAAGRRAAAQFIHLHAAENRFCVASQEMFDGFDNFTRIVVEPLTGQEIDALVKRELGEERAAPVLAVALGPALSLYSVPHNLIVGLELVKHGQALPESGRLLYEALLEPAAERWRRAGRSDCLDLVCERAYEMMRTRSIVIRHDQGAWPDELVDELVQRRLCVRRGDVLQFSHELVRAYLAAQHVMRRWNGLLARDGHTYDRNAARTTFEFALVGLLEDGDRREAKELLFRLIDAAPMLAGDVFSLLKRDLPSVAAEWADQFEPHFGRAVLESQSPISAAAPAAPTGSART